MAFQNPPEADIQNLLRNARTIAVVGLSDNPDRPSHRVADALQEFGYRIIPVNPAIKWVLGVPAAPDLDRAAEQLAPGEKIHIVDVFRQPQFVPEIVEACIRLEAPALWLQDGVIHEEAAERARRAGIFVVMDRCLYRDRAAL